MKEDNGEYFLDRSDDGTWLIKSNNGERFKFNSTEAEAKRLIALLNFLVSEIKLTANWLIKQDSIAAIDIASRLYKVIGM